MKPKTSSRLTWSLWGAALAWGTFAVTTAFVIATLTLGFTRPTLENSPSPTYVDVAFAVAFWMFSPVGAVIASRVRRNPIGWIMLGIGFFEGFAGFVYEYSNWALFVRPSLPGGAITAWLGLFIWAAGLGLMPWLMLLFPTGKFLTRRWRWVAYPSALAIAVMAVLSIFIFDVAVELASDPEGEFPNPLINLIAQTTVMTMFGSLVASMIGFIVRFRRSRGLERQQLKWLTFPAGLAAFLIAVNIFVAGPLGIDDTALGNFAEFLLNLTAMALPIGVGIAILRHGLFDIDLIINKTLVYGALAALITAFYLGVVIGIGTILGSESNLLLSIAATAVIAAAFQPLRRRLQAVGNRLVYGQRVTPYEAMAEFSHQMAAAPSIEEILPRMAEMAARGVGAAKTEVSIFLADGDKKSAGFPEARIEGQHSNSFDLVVPIDHRGELIGEVAVAKSRGETVTTTEERLLRDLATQAGPALRNVRLTEELRASRQRLVAAQDEERRRMERDIHDGAQQQLVAMAVKLGLAESLAERDSHKTKALLREIKAESAEAVETLRDLARGLFPQILAERGLISAVQAHVSKMNIHATVHANSAGDRRFDPIIEAAIYFCIREALQNASKHAGGAEVEVEFHANDDFLTFAVKDRGPGFDLSKARLGSGMQNMKDRVEALRGNLEIESSPGRGTSIRGRVPTQVDSLQ